ncbi:MAG: DNA-directed RNA polymerase subunit omega [Chthoniobacterales bacterium]
MNSILLKNAVAVIPETELLVNVVRLRVRQLVNGHRALVLTPPGMGLADVALSEIAAGKLTSESTGKPITNSAVVIDFPGSVPKTKAA